MIRHRKVLERGSGQGMSWMVTFADLMTLLFSFFLLLFSMSSLDRSVLREATSQMFSPRGLLNTYGAGRVPARFKIVEDALETPLDLVKNPRRIQDVLFPDEVLPANMSRGDLEENLRILLRPEGVALVLSEGLLFRPGQSGLSDDARKLLREFAQFIASMPTQVCVAGYTDNSTGTSVDNLTLSGDRALAVLQYFLEFGLDPERFSVAGYGEAFPLADNALPEGRARNRRVEILLKTTGQTYL